MPCPPDSLALIAPARVPDGRPINRSSPIEKGMKFVPVREQGSHEGMT